MTFTPHIQPSQNDEDGTSASHQSRRRLGPGCQWLKGQKEWGRRQGGVVGWVGWLAGWDGWPGVWLAGSGGGQGGVSGRVGWRAGSGGGLGDRRGMDLQSKECSGVNIVT